MLIIYSRGEPRTASASGLMEDRFKGLVDELALEFNQKTQQLEQTEARLMEEQVSLELEKQTMAKVPVAANDIVDLTAGGRLFTTRRTSLTQVRNADTAIMCMGIRPRHAAVPLGIGHAVKYSMGRLKEAKRGRPRLLLASGVV